MPQAYRVRAYALHPFLTTRDTWDSFIGFFARDGNILDILDQVNSSGVRLLAL